MEPVQVKRALDVALKLGWVVSQWSRGTTITVTQAGEGSPAVAFLIRVTPGLESFSHELAVKLRESFSDDYQRVAILDLCDGTVAVAVRVDKDKA